MLLCQGFCGVLKILRNSYFLILYFQGLKSVLNFTKCYCEVLKNLKFCLVRFIVSHCEV